MELNEQCLHGRRLQVFKRNCSTLGQVAGFGDAANPPTAEWLRSCGLGRLACSFSCHRFSCLLFHFLFIHLPGQNVVGRFGVSFAADGRCWGLVFFEPEELLRGGEGIGVRTRRAGQIGERAGAGRRGLQTESKVCPGPLPLGKGMAGGTSRFFNAHPANPVNGNFKKPANDSPSPSGRGRGEGECHQIVRTPDSLSHPQHPACNKVASGEALAPATSARSNRESPACSFSNENSKTGAP
jgi:hypothetical protein